MTNIPSVAFLHTALWLPNWLNKEQQTSLQQWRELQFWDSAENINPKKTFQLKLEGVGPIDNRPSTD